MKRDEKERIKKEAAAQQALTEAHSTTGHII